MKFRKRPVEVEAHRWFKNGDHPEDGSVMLTDCSGIKYLSEGKVVRRFRRPDMPGTDLCPFCRRIWHVHGWIDGHRNGGAECTVCPGDWIIKGVAGEFYPCKSDIFEKTYERVEE